uniref:Uncharacterized protein n=1 Tax=Oryza sativa subsp. japonica TaxID=39947 RepID=Q5Z935_ORYSJ|nr:hypothetical protein [Oryza sativa Japonica Group]
MDSNSLPTFGKARRILADERLHWRRPCSHWCGGGGLRASDGRRRAKAIGHAQAAPRLTRGDSEILHEYPHDGDIYRGNQCLLSYGPANSFLGLPQASGEQPSRTDPERSCIPLYRKGMPSYFAMSFAMYFVFMHRHGLRLHPDLASGHFIDP